MFPGGDRREGLLDDVVRGRVVEDQTASESAHPGVVAEEVLFDRGPRPVGQAPARPGSDCLCMLDVPALQVHTVGMKRKRRTRPRPGAVRRQTRGPGHETRVPGNSKPPGAVQYTVRNVPRAVDAALRRKAAEERKSLNELLRQALAKEVGAAPGARRAYHDLDHLAGTWVEDPEFDAALAAQDVIDESLWK